MRTVTALRERPRDRVEVSLDGAPWRVVPAVAVVRCGLRVGRPLDRPLARALGRELRRARALAAAGRALRTRDRSAAELDGRLRERGVAAGTRAEALDALEQAGLVDDDRFSRTRAAALADRGWSDAAIRADLEQRGLEADAVAAALAELSPEPERVAAAIARDGATPRLLRRLASRGFDADALEGLAGLVAPDG